MKLVDHRNAFYQTFNADKQNALKALGGAATELIKDKMLTGYANPIFDTGNLFYDVRYEVFNDHVTVGNTLHYGKYVHSGTSKMIGRPYMQDALIDGKDILQTAAAEQLKEGL